MSLHQAFHKVIDIASDVWWTIKIFCSEFGGLFIMAGLMAIIVGPVLWAKNKEEHAPIKCYYTITNPGAHGPWSESFCIYGQRWGTDKFMGVCYSSYNAAAQSIIQRGEKVCP